MTPNETHWLFHLLYLGGYVVSVGLATRIVMRKLNTGVALAWILVVLLVPYLGALLYLLIGENRLGDRRSRRAREIHQLFAQWSEDLQARARASGSEVDPPLRPICRLATNIVGLPVLPGNHLQLLDNYPAIFATLIEDIDAARHTCHLQFYIWHVGGLADQVVEALLRARARGVACRVQVDAVGSKLFLASEPARRLREAGAELTAMLPVGPFRLLLRRGDLRNHRKIVVIDSAIAYSGSQNLVDPRYFKQEQGVGEWIDLMVRITGPSVEELEGVFIEDRQFEREDAMELLEAPASPEPAAPVATVAVQVVPSGPVFRYRAIHQLLTTALYAARRQLIIVTPYFVPDESLKMAMLSAAQRGVEVILVVPEAVDSWLVRNASRSMFDELLGGGVRIAEFGGGLLHTKALIVDDGFSIVGSVNMDMRSLWLNFEISLFIYDRGVNGRLRALVDSYLADSRWLDHSSWRRRPAPRQLVENLVRLVGPLL